MEKENCRVYGALDLAKLLCAFLMLFYHYFSENQPSGALWEEFLSLYAVAVALFMAISGFLTFNKLAPINGTSARWAVAKNHAIRILKVYLLWSILYVIYNISRWDFSTLTFSFVFWRVQSWIFSSTFYTIWFMPSLAGGLILAFWLTEKLPEIVIAILAALLYFTGSLCLTYQYFGNQLPGFPAFMGFAECWLGGARGWLFFGFPMVLVGRAVAKRKSVFSWPHMLILSFFFMGFVLFEALVLRKIGGHTGIDMTFMMIPAVFCILGFLICCPLAGAPVFVWMRKMSVLIFVSQRLFLTVIPTFLSAEVYEMLFGNRWIGAAVVISATVVFSAAIIAFSRRFQWLKNLY